MGHPESMSSSGNLMDNSGKIGCLGWFRMFRFRPFSSMFFFHRPIRVVSVYWGPKMRMPQWFLGVEESIMAPPWHLGTSVTSYELDIHRNFFRQNIWQNIHGLTVNVEYEASSSKVWVDGMYHEAWFIPPFLMIHSPIWMLCTLQFTGFSPLDISVMSWEMSWIWIRYLLAPRRSLLSCRPQIDKPLG